MGTFTFTYDNAEVAALLEGFKASYRYQEQIPDPENPGVLIDNPETLPQFSKRMLRKHLRSIHKRGVLELAALDQAKQDAIADADVRSDGFDVA